MVTQGASYTGFQTRPRAAAGSLKVAQTGHRPSLTRRRLESRRVVGRQALKVVVPLIVLAVLGIVVQGDLGVAGAKLAELEAAEIAQEIKRLALSDIAGIMHADGRVKLPHELDPATRAAVASFKIDEFGRIEYKFWDKNASLDRAAKILGLFKEDNSQQRIPLVTAIRLIALLPADEATGERKADGS